METELFGQKLAMPAILGPIGMAGMYAKRGEVQAAKAAQEAGLPFTLSTVSICALEEVAAGTTAPPWFQLYMIKDRGFMEELLQRAKAVKSPVLMFTVDLPTPGSRYRDVRAGLAGKQSLPDRIARGFDTARHIEWLFDVGLGGRPHAFGNIAGRVPGAKGPTDFQSWVGKNFDPSVTWKDIAWVRDRWDGPIVIKGVLDPEDARLAVQHGADGVVVSTTAAASSTGCSPARPPCPRSSRRSATEDHRPGRWRRPLGPRRAEGPGAGRQGRDARPRLGFRFGWGRRRGRRSRAARDEKRAARGHDAHRLHGRAPGRSDLLASWPMNR